MKKLFIIITISLLIQSCEKDKNNSKPNEWNVTLFQTDIEYQRIANTANNIYCYGFKTNSNNTGLIYSLIKSNNTDIYWEKIDITPNNIYEAGGWAEMSFFNDTVGFITGYRKLFRTFDGGYNWDTISLGYDSFLGLFIHKNKIFGYNGAQFRYSKNFGEDWVMFDEPKIVSSLCFINDTEGLASSPEGLYETKDGGASWSLKSKPGIEFLRMDFADNKNGIATSIFQNSPHAYPQTFINITNDGGFTWQTIKLDSVSDAQLEPETSILYKSPDEIYVGCVNGIFLSKDKGVTWKQDFVDTLYNGSIFIRDIKVSNEKIIAVGWGGLILTN